MTRSPGLGVRLRRVLTTIGATTVLIVSMVGTSYAASAPPRAGKTAAAAAAPQTSGRQAATFGIGPANGKGIDGRAGLTFLASPGSTLQDRVAVVNLAAKAVTLNLYAADAAAGADGSIGYQPRARRATDAAAWIAPQTPGRRASIVLRARQTAIIPLVVTIPRDATPGDHVAGVIASLTSKVKNKSGQLIDFEQRVALRTSFRVSGAVRAQLSVEALHATYAGSLNPFGSGTATVTYVVRNTGNVTVGARQRVAVSGLFGEDSAPDLPTIPPLLPKASTRMNVTVPDVLPQVRLTGRVTLFPLVVPGSTAPGLAPSYEASVGFWAIPWALLALLVLLVLIAVATVLALRRRGRRASTASSKHRRTSRPPLSRPLPHRP